MHTHVTKDIDIISRGGDRAFRIRRGCGSGEDIGGHDWSDGIAMDCVPANLGPEMLDIWMQGGAALPKWALNGASRKIAYGGMDGKGMIIKRVLSAVV